MANHAYRTGKDRVRQAKNRAKSFKKSVFLDLGKDSADSSYGEAVIAGLVSLWAATHAWCNHAADVDLLKTLWHFEQAGIGLAFMDI